MAVDPYAAPKSRVADVPQILSDSAFVANGRSVAGGNGWKWITDAWEWSRARKASG
jgi:hypothetical protein